MSKDMYEVLSDTYWRTPSEATMAIHAFELYGMFWDDIDIEDFRTTKRIIAKYTWPETNFVKMADEVNKFISSLNEKPSYCDKYLSFLNQATANAMLNSGSKVARVGDQPSGLNGN